MSLIRDKNTKFGEWNLRRHAKSEEFEDASGICQSFNNKGKFTKLPFWNSIEIIISGILLEHLTFFTGVPTPRY